MMKRGEIRLVAFDPAVGAKAAKTRPAVLVSNDGANTTAARLGRGVITVVPITSNIERVYPFQTLLSARESGLGVDSKAQTEQIRSISVQRLGRVVGEVPSGVLEQLDDALRLHLSL